MATKKHATKKIAVLYHADCADGFGAAWAAWKKFKDSALYFAVPPSNRELPAKAARTDIFTLDYSFPFDTIVKIREQVNSLTVIDHHETNKEAALSADNRLFDMAHSGAALFLRQLHTMRLWGLGQTRII